ncbi:50S ribosomal protein L14 [Candidatus Berkelbacteria bacterium]|nr:50S ribosomal protein L14 [Candidatus Berkelbacteria bacterium]
MFQHYSRFIVTDNTGARQLMAIRVLGGAAQDRAGLGDTLIGTVKSAAPAATVKKKSVVRAVIVRARRAARRTDGSYIRFDDNAVVLINADGTPRGTRVFGPIAREIRDKGYMKIVSLAPEVL